MPKVPISILIVDDEPAFLETAKNLLELEGYFVATSKDGLTAINELQIVPYDLVLLDIEMPQISGIEVLKFIKDRFPELQVIMLTGVDDLSIAVNCMKMGAFHYVTKPYQPAELLSLIDRALERKRLLAHNIGFRNELAAKAMHALIIGQDKTLIELLSVASRVAPTDSSVLIQGSSGTGKELIANFIHANSLRKEHPFLALNCSSFPDALIESELFGHEKGAFTDAVTSKQGLMEVANGGTVFLDEIAEIPRVLQPKLLRFLQTGEYRRVGGNRIFRSDVRILSATNRDLHREVQEGRFREDLFYRLNVFTLKLPPLRERRNDIPQLIEHFITAKNKTTTPKRIDEKALEILLKYSWPGNIRELENVIERASILCEGNVILPEDLALPFGMPSMFEGKVELSNTVPRIGGTLKLDEIQKLHIAAVLDSVRWNKPLAAKILGISVKTLYSKIQAFQITQPE
ncbi:MAG: sigma-54 dependent transcriptional regulator [bacterium]